jgi:15-cis-phytoene synthase
MTTQPHGRGGLTLACRLLPRDLRPDVNALYTVFRTLDDLVDEGDASVAAARVAAVERWCESGSVTSAEAAALDAIEARRGVPAGPLRAFCEGMRHDLDGGVLVTEDDVDRYCGQVAGSVGEVMTVWLGQRWPCLDRARSLGVALQRTNILRDLDEDLARGRVYVAAETLDRFGPALPGRRDALLRDQIALAYARYDEGIAGVGGLARGRPAIAAAAATYREILRTIEREGHGRRPGRVVVPWPRRAAVAARAAAAA